MRRTAFLVRSVGIAALMAVASPAFAGDDERASRAIAAAQGKIEAASNMGLAAQDPELHARAQSALRSAQENLKRGRETDAFEQANEASTLADLALNRAQQQRQSEDANARANADAAVNAAQRDAADANARADAAQQAAATAAAEAQAARAAPPVVVAAPSTTTVTTETVRPQTRVATSTTTRARPKRTVRRATTTTSRPATVERTTTTVTQSN